MRKRRFENNRISGRWKGPGYLGKKKNAGTTMVELIVSFALLAIFLTTVTMVISNALMTYYNERRLMSMYSVTNTVFSEIRNDIRTMQPSQYQNGPSGTSVDANGFIKLRNADGSKVVASKNTEATGETIEFLKANEQDGMILEQIDVKGCSADTALIEAGEDVRVIKERLKNTVPAGQLTARFYLKAPESNVNLRNYFMDVKHDNSVVPEGERYNLIDSGTPVVWDAEDRLPTELYQGFTVKTFFTVLPKGDDLTVSSVQVTVELYDPANPTEKVYGKTGTVPLQNTVFYNNDKTVYSEVTLP